MDTHGTESFSALVSSDAWRAEVEEWVHDRVEERGHRISGPLDQRRVCAWSTQIVVPTDAGRLWFKANCPSMAFEPALHDLLSRVVPKDVDRPYAVAERRGWMMTSDRGDTLGEGRDASLEDWRAVVSTAAHLQRELAGHREAVLATGVPDCAAPTVPDRFTAMVDHLSDLPGGHPSHVDDGLRRELLDVVPRLTEACEQIAASPVPVTVQHGDLHPGNVFAAGEPGARTLRIFDFGDVQWAPAVEVLNVPFGVITQEQRRPWEPVRDAYAQQWLDVVDPRSLNALWEATAFTQPVNRAQTWWDSLRGATVQETADWGVAPLHHLRRVLDA